MKAFDAFNPEPVGSIPPQLFKYIDGENIRGATDEFIHFINDIALQLHTRLSGVEDTKKNVASVKLDAPKLFGQDVTLDFIGSGTMASVYKIKIGTETFALKINTHRSYVRSDELGVIKLQRSARNLVNKTYIGAPFRFGGYDYTWLLSDYVAGDRLNSYERGREKILYARLTKGLDYSDPGIDNLKDGKIIDLAGVYKTKPLLNLTRTEIDMVKKLVHCMRTDDMPRFQELLNRMIITNPSVVKHMFLNMVIKSSDMPPRLKPYLNAINMVHTNMKEMQKKSRDI